MSYLIIAVIAHLTTGIANVIDKVVVSKYLKTASVYAFYVGILSAVSLVLIPFGVAWPGMYFFIFSVVSGVLFVLAFYLMNDALLRGEVSRVITMIGGSVPVFSLILAFVFLGERLNALQLISFFLLVTGIVLMGWVPGKEKIKHSGAAIRALGSGLFFSLTFVGSKYLYDNLTFINGFFWRGIGGVLAAVLMLLYPVWRRDIIADISAPAAEQRAGKILILVNQAIGAVGFVILNLAIAAGSVTIVNSLQGIQYAFIFLAAVLLGKKIPQLKENLSRRIVIQKLSAILVIIAGLAVLAIS